MNKLVPNKMSTNVVHPSEGLQITSKIRIQNLEIPYVFHSRAYYKFKLSFLISLGNNFLKNIIDFVVLKVKLENLLINQTRENNYILHPLPRTNHIKEK
jgi:hypothetical protein